MSIQEVQLLFGSAVFLCAGHDTYILYGNSEMGAHMRSNLCNLIYLRHFIRSREDTNRDFFSPKRPFSLQSCATYSELPSNISTGHGSGIQRDKIAANVS